MNGVPHAVSESSVAPASTLGASLACPLVEREILVTRPIAQADALVRAIRAEGGIASCFPSLSIEAIVDTRAMDACLAQLTSYDLVVAASVNAAEHAHERSRALGLTGLQAVACAAAPGPATAAALTALGVGRVVVPESRFDSEGLVAALDACALAPARVLILRGTDGHDGDPTGTGRAVVGDWLRARGALVDSIACYARLPVKPDPDALATLLAGRAPDAAIVTSAEGGANFHAILGARGRIWIAGVPIFVPHARVAARMHDLGMSDIHVAAAGDSGIVATLVDHFDVRRG